MSRIFSWFLSLITVTVCCFGQSGARIISHISSVEGGFTPGIVIANTAATGVQHYQLHPYTAAGEALPEISGSVETGTTIYASLTELFGRNDISHLVVAGDEGVMVSTTYQAVVNDSTPVHVHASSEQSRVWRIYPGDWNAVWDGIAIVNTGDYTASVIIQQKDAQGETLITKDAVQIEPFAKYLAVLGENFSQSAGSHFEISSDQPTALTALRGSDDNRFLWANLPIAQQSGSTVHGEARYEVSRTSGVKYGEGLVHSNWNSADATPMDLLLDVYEPVGAEGLRPVVVFIHGGGFIGGSRTGQPATNFANYFAARGFVAFSISYRLANHHGTVPQTYYDAAVELGLQNSQLDQVLAMYTAGRDAKAAIRWVRANADIYNLDLSRITAAGGSAGAITAVALGTTRQGDFRDELTLSEDPTLATTHLDQDDSVHTVVDYWGSSAMTLVLANAYNLANIFDPTDAPLIIIHGTEDRTVTYDKALELEAIYQNTGAYYELYPLVGEGHSAWDATIDGVGIDQLAFDFVTRMQAITVNP